MRKLFALAVLIASTFAAASAPSAEAIAACSSTYCSGKPGTTACACPAGTDRAGDTAYCWNWNSIRGCWYE